MEHWRCPAGIRLGEMPQSQGKLVDGRNRVQKVFRPWLSSKNLSRLSGGVTDIKSLLQYSAKGADFQFGFSAELCYTQGRYPLSRRNWTLFLISELIPI